ncbi:UDP-2,4-diacetamido-2,4,6-trideoxy-beta-L-altropyranose hydrolase [Arsenicibacter rosenii]|uniref:UDP-2,4-diacetamido-2,4, 6-trideoxy-beta-L-altropyranose hydrolase n=1 Tax=Arsenicibacter rosenii TaxID=1750698 RepID=A0A1S2VI73_9BACT|nr:UDP-2,4-diacetamido-2,4,6-trideoxy-beta-L-altropyranose hydrolase [Arsenicibacter rosenii]OIN57916.1 UDP-2,4-diacetamido-2,4,6-trideoxy-beta-L-altropyranose hydrolase [Arsenicibacter rosenii]
MSGSASKTIFFRMDGGPQIGLGHVMRCLALADMLMPAFSCTFCICQPAGQITQLLTQKGISVQPLASQDVSGLLDLLPVNSLIVLDGYHFDETYQRHIKAAGHTLVFIDDLMTGHQVADVVINHTPGITADRYLAEPYTRFCFGTAYALVNPVFQPAPLQPESPYVLVNLGGADPQNMSRQLVEWLLECPDPLVIRVVLGGANVHVPTFANLPADRVVMLRNLSVPEMAREMEQCRYAILSCSTVSYELATIGRPFIGIQTAGNQQYLADFFEKEKLAVHIFTWPPDADRFREMIHAIRPDQGVAAQRRFLDGRSAERFRALFDHLTTN